MNHDHHDHPNPNPFCFGSIVNVFSQWGFSATLHFPPSTIIFYILSFSISTFFLILLHTFSINVCAFQCHIHFHSLSRLFVLFLYYAFISFTRFPSTTLLFFFLFLSPILIIHFYFLSLING